MFATCLLCYLASDPRIRACRQCNHCLGGSSLLLRRNIREVSHLANHFAECWPSYQFFICVVSLLLHRVLSLAKLEEPKGSIQAVIASDLVFLWWQNELDTLKMLGITVVMILSICALDRSFLPHKRRYSHLFELPTVQEYH